MTFDAIQTRNRSLSDAKSLGFPVNPDLPPLELGNAKPATKVERRLLTLSAVLAVAHGLSQHTARDWLKGEGLWSELCISEESLMEGKGDSRLFQPQVDAVYALAWAAGLVLDLHFDSAVPDDLVTKFPDVRINGSSAGFRISLRSDEEILQKLDLAYCLHWAIVEATLTGSPLPGKLHPMSIIERRRGLEWLFSPEPWDSLDLDT